MATLTACQGAKTDIAPSKSCPTSEALDVVIELADGQKLSVDTTEVTVAQFAEFVKATKYITTAEQPQDGFDMTGGAVFVTPTATSPNWWKFVEGANWQYPEGPDQPKAAGTEPVVQISYQDAQAYAAWRGRRLPTEAEWEFVARAGGDSKYFWGDEKTPNGQHMANIWQGAFPLSDSGEDGFVGRAPVGSFTPNDFGLYDVSGNVCEWTASPASGRGNSASQIIKGGSYLYADNYCRRYQTGASETHEVDFSTNHIGFRTVADIE